MYERIEHVFGRNHVAADQQFGFAHRWYRRQTVRATSAGAAPGCTLLQLQEDGPFSGCGGRKFTGWQTEKLKKLKTGKKWKFVLPRVKAYRLTADNKSVFERRAGNNSVPVPTYTRLNIKMILSQTGIRAAAAATTLKRRTGARNQHDYRQCAADWGARV